MICLENLQVMLIIISNPFSKINRAKIKSI
jgi:hypothetical protein